MLVLATDRPERDEWVDEQAAAEAYRGGFPLAPYQGTDELPYPYGTTVHLFALDEDAAAAREHWALARANAAKRSL